MCRFLFETRIDYGNMVSAMFDEKLKVEVAIVAASYEAVWEQAINRAENCLVKVKPTIGIVEVKFDEEPLTSDEWLHMMQ